jgi:RNA polymerase sigma-70 factor (ECF subfamily)
VGLRVVGSGGSAAGEHWGEATLVGGGSELDGEPRWGDATAEPATEPSADELLRRVARGDEDAFRALYDLIAARVYGMARRVVRDPAQAEEVAQEALVEVWRTAPRFDPSRGSASAWVMTIAHRRAVDRVRAAQAGADRERRVAAASVDTPYDDVVEGVTASLEQQQVRRCLQGLTDLQREAITLAYYDGYSYREVAEKLDAALPTIKSRLRDGLIRLRDCLGVAVSLATGAGR